MPLNEVRISPLDRGYHFGDGIYEVFRLYSGKFFMEEAHWRRFDRSLNEMQIELPDTEAVKKKCHELVALQPAPNGMLYLQVTRGVGAKREHGFPTQCTPQILAMVSPLPKVFPPIKTEGCAVITLPDLRWKRCDIKSLNLLANVMGATQAKEAGCYESIFINERNEVTEGSRSNLLAVINGELRTMPTSGNILPGISRLLTLQLAHAAGIAVREEAISKNELAMATEIFLTNTTADIYPIVVVDGVTVGDGNPGALTTILMERFSEFVEKTVGPSTLSPGETSPPAPLIDYLGSMSPIG